MRTRSLDLPKYHQNCAIVGENMHLSVRAESSQFAFLNCQMPEIAQLSVRAESSQFAFLNCQMPEIALLPVTSANHEQDKKPK